MILTIQSRKSSLKSDSPLFTYIERDCASNLQDWNGDRYNHSESSFSKRGQVCAIINTIFDEMESRGLASIDTERGVGDEIMCDAYDEFMCV